jgi:hypothetical protein
MRVVLVPTLMLLCAAPIFAQATPADVQLSNSAAIMPGQPMGSPQPSPLGRLSTAPADVSPDTPVVTLDGICDQPHVPARKACKTVITREQIDSMMDLLTPGASPAARRTFALSYARLLAASGAAEQQHLEKDPAVAAELQEQLKLTRIRVLANSFYHQMEVHAADVPESEIQKYYAGHQSRFEAGKVRRLSIPRAALTKSTQPMDASVVKANMDELVARASKGEDFDQVQKEAYIMFGIATPPPPTTAIMMRRSSLRPDEAVVFDLNAGEVTQMLNSPDAFVILKLESKEPIPIESAASEIKPIVQQLRKTEVLQMAEKNVTADFNLAYLGMSSTPELFVPPAAGQAPALRAAGPELRPRVPVRRRAPMGAELPKGFPSPR